MGTTDVLNIAASSSTKSSGSSSATFIIIIVVIFAAFYFLMIRPNQRRRQQQQQQANTLGRGARVRTTAGMYATVVEVDGDDVVLEVAPGVEMRFMKRAIMDVVSPGEPPEDTYEDDAEQADEDVDDDAGTTDDETGTTDDEAEHVTDADDTSYEKATGTKKD